MSGSLGKMRNDIAVGRQVQRASVFTAIPSPLKLPH